MATKLRLKGVKENNLKNLDLEIDHNTLSVLTGLSGSGKSSLALDTIYAEGGRRYIETFSPYTRQFLDRFHKPKLDHVSGLRPALALGQQNKAGNSRSTIGTATEINDYLKILWAETAEIVCTSCNKKIQIDSEKNVLKAIEKRLCDEQEKQLLICFPIKLQGKASLSSLKETLLSQGFIRLFSEEKKEIIKTEELSNEELKDSLLVVFQRFKQKSFPTQKNQVRSSIKQAYYLGKDQIKIVFHSAQKVSVYSFSQKLECKGCKETFQKPKPSLFSFNSPNGACSKCKGFGKVLEIDPKLCIPDQSLSMEQGAILPWNTKNRRKEFNNLIQFCEENSISTNKPWSKLSKNDQNLVLHGKNKFKGLFGWFQRLQRKIYKMHIRVLLSRYRSEFCCPECNGSRLKKETNSYVINQLTISSLWKMQIKELDKFFNTLLKKNSDDEFSEFITKEIISRILYLKNIGLGYLALDREMRSLSGGEAQRVNLTTILGSRMCNTLLVLDEPTIGLHTRDTKRLIEILHSLKEKQNSLLVVEHDSELINSANNIIDLGPRSGENGGQIIYQGQSKGLSLVKKSLTANYLDGSKQVARKHYVSLDSKQKNTLKVRDANTNNLKYLNLDIPLGGLVALTGVSGSGKSSLCNFIYKNYKSQNKNSKIDEIILIDQSPIGKTPRSNAATYTKSWELIRTTLAETKEAEKLGLNKSSFSFNVDGGRCPTCKGAGALKVEMQFLADAFIECETCNGKRFQQQILDISFHGKTVSDFLEMTLEESSSFFQKLDDEKKSKKINELIKPLLDLDLGYLKLGQPLNTVSGGEAQRIKLASYLNQDFSKNKFLFILDEPTRGLHPDNVNALVNSFQSLIEQSHSLLVVEHNLDLIKEADWLIELGPDGGNAGGELIAEGKPRELVKNKSLIKKSETLECLNEHLNNLGNQSKKKEGLKKELKKTKQPLQPIVITGAKHHNLKNISLEVPKNKLNVITGVSGSGKSSLAFDIIFAEGQRRYIDCLSPYARQFIKQLDRADVDLIDSVPPTIAVSQKTAAPYGISTIATTTEIYQYLRLLFSKLGKQHCPEHPDTEVTSFTPEKISEELINNYKGKKIFVFAPVISGRKGFHNDVFRRAYNAEIEEAKVDKEIIRIEPGLKLERHKLHWISLLVASINKPEKNHELVKMAVEQSLIYSGTEIEVSVQDKHAKPIVHSIERVCPKCQRGFHKLDPQDFSFSSNRGVCTHCNGKGYVGGDEFSAVKKVCPSCRGARISEIGRNVKFTGKTIDQLCKLNAKELLKFISKLKFEQRLSPVAKPIQDELISRLNMMISVGLDYISLDRDSSSISGGEAQRLRLARSIGSPLSGVCYVFDEPSIGLHSSDHQKLMQTLFQIRDLGNTLVVVEHDFDTITQADNIIDIGPEGGSEGGELVSNGTLSKLLKSKSSITAKCIKERSSMHGQLNPVTSNKKGKDFIELNGVTTNNLKNISVKFPLQRLNLIAGVSGSGKSSLVKQSLIPAIFAAFENTKKPKKNHYWGWKELKGVEKIDRFVEIDQTPVGKTSSSIPASYLKIFDEIRKIYAALPDAQIRGWNPSHFSFNSGKGRCSACEGKGFIKIPMSFLPDARNICEDCSGMRYNEETLEIKYKGLSLGEALGLTISEAVEQFSNHKKIKRTLDYVNELGLGYLSLGQATHTLSGGEAQRIKIAKELGSADAKNTLYVLDEPTTGLHMNDVDKLIDVLSQLIRKGNTVLIIEHNLDVIRRADYLLELGPGPGEQGGEVVFAGTPGELKKGKRKTPTKTYL